LGANGLISLRAKMEFNIYIFPTEAILRMLHHIDFKLGDLTVWVKNKFKKKINLNHYLIS
jgi:uncharacterized protein YaaR (DUF327 family)